MRRVYFDYAATTPVADEVKKAMAPYFSDVFGNAASFHWFGQQASAAVSEARGQLAAAIKAKDEEIIFTGSATEANNLAFKGLVLWLADNLKLRTGDALNFKKPKIITTAIEHDSIFQPGEDLKKQGVEVVYLKVDKDGFVDWRQLKEELDERTILVSVIYANNEIGTIQDLPAAAKIISEFKEGKSDNSQWPLFHTDAVQALQYLDCDVGKLGVDLMTFSAHKIYGPKGMGALYIKEGAKKFFRPIISGGGQEFGLRAGTINVPYIVGFGKAVELAVKRQKKEAVRISKLKDYFWRELKKKEPRAALNGSLKWRLPNNLNIYFFGRPAQDFAIELDLLGISVSPGVACSSRTAKPSRVIGALGHQDDRPASSLRITFGRPTTKNELDYALKILKKRM